MKANLIRQDPPNYHDAENRDNIGDVYQQDCDAACHVLGVIFTWAPFKGDDKVDESRYGDKNSSTAVSEVCPQAEVESNLK